MKILAISNQSVTDACAALFAERGAHIGHISPSALSAFTAMKVRKALNKGECDVVAVGDLGNAMAAISAREISRDVHIVYFVAPNADVPKGIPADIRNGVDAWIFPSQRLCDAFPDSLKRKLVVPTADVDGIIEGKVAGSGNPLHMAWIGPMDGNTQRLVDAVNAIDEAPDGSLLTICGTGKAQKVMPAVRQSRAICHPERVVWAGDKCDIVATVSEATAVVQSGMDAIGIEMGAAVMGRKLVQPCEIKDIDAAQAVKPFTRGEYADAVVSILNDLRL